MVYNTWCSYCERWIGLNGGYTDEVSGEPFCKPCYRKRHPEEIEPEEE